MRMKLSAVAPFALLAALGLVAAGCSSEGSTPTAQPSSKSPDTSAKDPSKTPANNGAGTDATMPMKPTTPTVPSATPKAQSPDASAKDLTKTPVMQMDKPFKDATHVLKMDTPYFAAMPMADAKPDGTWKSGTPVLVMVPGAPYSQVKTASGSEAYVSTMSLKSIAK